MDQEPTPDAGLGLRLPIEGVEEVLAGWSGEGQLYAALAAISGDDPEVRWSATDVRRRAHRVLAERVAADVLLWPESVDEWLPHLPVSTASERLVAASPRGRVDWRETARRHGWPPTAYVSRARVRQVADVTLNALAWTVAELSVVLRDATTPAFASLALPLRARLDVALAALEFAEVPDAIPRPDRLDLEALHTSGRPWADVGKVTAELLSAATDLKWLATELLAPDESLRWRLFHLAALGHVLAGLRAAGARVTWRVPLGMGGAASGPNFEVTLPDSRTCDLWFEAASAHAHYARGERSLYSQAVVSVRNAERDIGADVALFVPGRRALLLECKFSSYASYVGRNGYHQAAGYALNVRGVAPEVWSYIVGPEEVVPTTGHTDALWAAHRIRLGATNAKTLPDLVDDFLSA